MPRTRKQASKIPEERAKGSGLNAESFNKSYKNALRTYEADVKLSMLMVQSILKMYRNLISPEIGNRLYEDVVKEVGFSLEHSCIST
ncbi:hypothetical protein PR048_032513 [Dryococelus australis]|uniref:Uncharacterized protein n=1 Tax=Dryococelus australis TaxID=614101 RepID=A0ABQ9G5D6_9NEOP|nr:hypothetical protein PR048_032513 [Dryococelus australis]